MDGSLAGLPTGDKGDPTGNDGHAPARLVDGLVDRAIEALDLDEVGGHGDPAGGVADDDVGFHDGISVRDSRVTLCLSGLVTGRHRAAPHYPVRG